MNDDWLSYCDFRDFKQYEKDVCDFQSECLIHLGAYTDLEFCELNADDTYVTNTLSVENACYISNKLKIPIIYISTAGIFDGAKEVYDDWDIPNPLCHYSRSKYAGEVFVQKQVQNHLIARAGLSLIHISEPTRRTPISYAVFCLKKAILLCACKLICVV